ncbi:hypothetical protein BHE74_00046182 [Ensete ventricosum]|nr:hypothetical protein BHE74_00046182 [Ensete ventricosum]
MRRCCAPQVAASARGRALLPLGDSPYELATSPYAATWSAGPPAGAVPTGGHRWSGCRTIGCRSYGHRATSGCPCGWLPLQGALATSDCPLASGQAVASCPSKGHGRGRPPFFLVAFTTKMQ